MALGYVFFAYELDCPLDPLDLAIDCRDFHLLPRLLHSSLFLRQEDPAQVFLGDSKILRILCLQGRIRMLVVQKKLIAFTIQDLDNRTAKHRPDDCTIIEHCFYGLI